MHAHAVHLALGALLTPCTVCGYRCDNYRVLHGRDVFNGDRLHAVSWFGDGTTKADKGDKPGDILNNLINSAF